MVCGRGHRIPGTNLLLQLDDMYLEQIRQLLTSFVPQLRDQGIEEGLVRGKADTVLLLLSEKGTVSGELEEMMRGERDPAPDLFCPAACMPYGTPPREPG